METSYQGALAKEEASQTFQRLSQTIASNIKKISQNVSSMSKMVNQLQTSQDSQELRSQLRHTQNYTQKLAKDTSVMLIELTKLPVDQPVCRLTKDRLQDEYMATLNAFQTTQRTAADKTKEDVRKVKAQSVTIGDPFAMNSNNQLVDTGDVSLRRQEQMTMQTERDLQELEQRERDIQQLELNILDVNDIFKQMGQLIHDQGTLVDNIENSVDNAESRVEAATAELGQAARHKSNLRKKKVYISIVLAIVLCIILILIFYH